MTITLCWQSHSYWCWLWLNQLDNLLLGVDFTCLSWFLKLIPSFLIFKRWFWRCISEDEKKATPPWMVVLFPWCWMKHWAIYYSSSKGNIPPKQKHSPSLKLVLVIMTKALTLSISLIFQRFLILLQFSRKMCPAIPFALKDQHPVFLQLLNPEKSNSHNHTNDLSI